MGYLWLASSPGCRVSNFVKLEDTITQICGHFIDIKRSGSRAQVSLIHTTARDFLLKGDGDQFVNAQQGHRHLALICLQHLSNEHWRRRFDSVLTVTRSQVKDAQANTPNKLLIADRDHPLLGYSALYWAYHVSKISY